MKPPCEPQAPHQQPGMALVTGASTGIGRELARLAAQDGYALILVARDAARLQALADELSQAHHVNVAVHPTDLSEPAAVDALLATLARDGRTVDVLINNAGVGLYGPFADADVATMQALLRLNIDALTRLTRALLPGMRAQRAGRILNVASTAAFQPGPLMAVYYASKAYVLSFSEALAEELRGTGVTVTTLCPGLTRSEFQARAQMGDLPLQRVGLMEASTVAQAGYFGLQHGARLVIPGWRNRLGVWLLRISPRAWVTRVVRLLQERRRA